MAFVGYQDEATSLAVSFADIDMAEFIMSGILRGFDGDALGKRGFEI